MAEGSSIGTIAAAITADELELFVLDEGYSEGNIVKPRIYLRNLSAGIFSNFAIHYYFTADPDKPPILEDWYTPDAAPRLELVSGGDNLYRLVYDYQGFGLAPGATTPNTSGTVVGLHYTDWSTWNKADDWSYTGVGSTFVESDHIVVVDAAGNIVYGTPPDPNGGSGGTGGTGGGSSGETATIQSFVLLSSGALQVRDRGHVNGDIGTHATVAPALLVGHDAHAAVGHRTHARSVVLQDRAVVGALRTDSLSAGHNTTSGEVGAFVAPPPLPEIESFTVGVTPLAVAFGTTQPLTPGKYGVVTVHGTLQLLGGTYEFASLALGNDASLIAVAPSKLRIAERLTAGDRSRMEPGAGLFADALHVIVAGAEDNAVALGNDSVVSSLLLAPQGGLLAGDRLSLEGAVVAGVVGIGNDPVVTHQAGFPCSTDVDCDDGQACTGNTCSDGFCNDSDVPDGTACNQGTCQAGSCQCDAGWEGPNCDVQSNPTEPCPCSPEATLFSPECGGRCRFEVPAPVGISADTLAISAYDTIILGAGSSSVYRNVLGQVTGFASVAQVGRRTSGSASGNTGFTIYAGGLDTVLPGTTIPIHLPGAETGSFFGAGTALFGAEATVHDKLWYFSAQPQIGAGVNAPPPEQHSVVRDRSYSRVLEFVPSTNGDVTTSLGQNLPLAPGRYGNVTIVDGSRLTLSNVSSAGTYLFSSLTVEDGGELAATSFPGIVWVTDAFSFSGSVIGGAGNLLLGYFGESATFEGDAFKGTFLAPRATFEVPQNAEGAFFGAAVALGQGASVTHVPFELSAIFHQPQDAVATGLAHHVNQGISANYDQSEGVAIVTRIDDFEYGLTVAYNDRTVDSADPRALYFADGTAPCTVDSDCSGSYCFSGLCGVPSTSAADATHRVVLPGWSLMGWSSSIDKGNSFTYGGRIAPPAGWSVVWGDPALASNQQTGSVYLANLGGSETVFAPGSVAKDVRPSLDGFCVARSSDSGRTFPEIRCFKRGMCASTGDACTGQPSDCGGNGVADCEASFILPSTLFYDGASIVTNGTDTYFSAINVLTGLHEVWRAQNDSLDFQPLADLTPFDGIAMIKHPRLRAFNGSVYIAGVDPVGFVRISIFDGLTWSPPRIVTNISAPNPTFPVSNLRLANQFAFDVGTDADGASELRTIYIRRSGTCIGTSTRCYFGPTECGGAGASGCTPVADGTPGSLFTEFSFCPADLPPHPDDPAFSQCLVRAFIPDFNNAFDTVMPVIEHSTRANVWQAAWLGQIVGTGTPELITTGVTDQPVVSNLLMQRVAPQTPCGYTDVPHYWGDYYDIISLGDGAGALDPEDRFFATFPDSRIGCRFQSFWYADINQAGVTFRPTTE